LRFVIGDRTYTPPEISALILKELKRRAEAALGGEIKKAVITVRPTSTTRSARRPRTPDDWRVSKCCGW